MAYEIKRFPYDGTVDADGHILEPADLWENYLEDKYRERALRIRVDDDGYEYLEIDQTPSKRSRKGSLGLLGAMGEEDMRPRPDRRYSDNMPFGSSDPGERLSLMAQENLEYCLLYPTIGLLWEVELTDPELSLAYCRAYNRWIADFCRDSNGKLVPIAQLTLLDVEGSVAELERAVKDGCRGAWVNPFNHNRVIHGSDLHDALFAKCVELDVPLARSAYAMWFNFGCLTLASLVVALAIPRRALRLALVLAFAFWLVGEYQCLDWILAFRD